MVGSGDFRNVFVRKVTMHAVHQGSHLARIDKERFAAPVAESSTPTPALPQ